MEFPQVLVFEVGNGEDEAADELARFVAELGIEAPCVMASGHGEQLGARLQTATAKVTPPRGADQEWASAAGSRTKRSGSDAIVAIGGGRCLDVAKLAATRAGVVLVCVPTQLSHDGICSPVAVVPDDTGKAESLGAVAPRGVFIPTPTIAGAPPASLAAGLGDLLANPLALRDWALAAEHGLEQVDQRAWDMSVESFEGIKAHLDVPPEESVRNPEFLRQLANALVLSGIAMICAGTSRPASGGEHEISHAIDLLYGGRAMHGEQVALGSVVSVALYGEDTDTFRERLGRLGLPQHPAELGLDASDAVRVLLAAPGTRQGRFTILEDADLDETSASALVRNIWNENP